MIMGAYEGCLKDGRKEGDGCSVRLVGDGGTEETGVYSV